VLTVVAKLLHMATPDVAVFGQKDFQQLVLIRRMVHDLDFPVRIVGGPIVREPDGLALSSRNVYLSDEERLQAALLSAALAEAGAAFLAGATVAAELIAIVHGRLAGGAMIQPQYVELVDAATLDAVEVAARGDVLAIAALVGNTRLIDNHVLGEGAA
jgi:pantoate--beta-alanine ligase